VENGYSQKGFNSSQVSAMTADWGLSSSPSPNSSLLFNSFLISGSVIPVRQMSMNLRGGSEIRGGFAPSEGSGLTMTGFEGAAFSFEWGSGQTVAGEVLRTLGRELFGTVFEDEEWEEACGVGLLVMIGAVVVAIALRRQGFGVWK
jgi:hypothetical protein